MNEKLVEFIENSFLKSLLAIPTVTDISYNGEDIYYVDNLRGRVKSEIKVKDDEVYQFLRQIVNISDAHFSYTEPLLDINVGKYRINATHYAITRKNRQQALNFSIRIGYDSLRIKNDGKFISSAALLVLDEAIKHKLSIAIGGKTGTGKTEFQKFLVSRFKENTRVIVIDNINELETDFFVQNLDSQTWLVDLHNKNCQFDDLIKNALRNNPDWIVIGESRGKEMLSTLNSAMSGHPTITTLHALNAESLYNRMARLCMISNESLSFDDTLIDIYDHFKFIVYLKSRYDFEKHKIVRFVDSLGTNHDEQYYEIYKYPNVLNDLPKSLMPYLEMNEEEFNDFNNKLKEKMQNEA